jgi:hypothetical protein
MELEIVHNQKVTRLEFDGLLAHSHAHRAVQGHHQFERLMPIGNRVVLTGGHLKKIDAEGKLGVELRPIALSVIQLPRNLTVRSKSQPAAGSEQRFIRLGPRF